jgi:hypothetical protein
VTNALRRSRRGRLACVITLFAVFGAARLSAQEAPAHRISIGALGGTWWSGQGYWPFVLVGAEYQATTHMTVGLQAGGVSRPVDTCPDGVCDRRKLIRMVMGNVRYELGSGTIRPYVGATFGPTWYYTDGTLMGLHAGAAVPAGSRWSFRLDGGVQLGAEREGFDGASTLQAGLYLRL